MSSSLWHHGLQHSRLPCPSLSPGLCPTSCPLRWWRCLTISSFSALFSFCLQSFSILIQKELLCFCFSSLFWSCGYGSLLNVSVPYKVHAVYSRVPTIFFCRKTGFNPGVLEVFQNVQYFFSTSAGILSFWPSLSTCSLYFFQALYLKLKKNSNNLIFNCT